MSSIVIAGDTSGSVTLQAPSVAGSTILTLPATSGTVQTSGAGFTTNGVAYASSTSALTTGSGLVFDGTNLGLGVTPSAWGTANSERALQLTGGSLWSYASFGLGLLNNAFYDSTGAYKYRNNGFATHYFLSSSNGQHAWFNAASGTAGNTVSFTQAMTLDASGNLGIGTSSPSTILDIGANNSTPKTITLRYSSVPTYLSSTYDGSFGLSTFSINSYNTSNSSASWSAFGNTGYASSAIQLASDTNGSQIRFLTASAVNTAPTSRARILASGSFELEKASNETEATAQLVINGNGYAAFHWLDSTAYYIGQNSSIRSLRIYSNSYTAGVNLAAGGTSWGTFSDERLKYDIEPITNGLDKLSSIRCVSYRLKDVDASDSQKKLGVIAQDLVGVVDEVIDITKRHGDETDYMSVRYTELIPVLIKSIQEQQAIIESLKARLDAANL